MENIKETLSPDDNRKRKEGIFAVRVSTVCVLAAVVIACDYFRYQNHMAQQPSGIFYGKIESVLTRTLVNLLYDPETPFIDFKKEFMYLPRSQKKLVKDFILEEKKDTNIEGILVSSDIDLELQKVISQKKQFVLKQFEYNPAAFKP